MSLGELNRPPAQRSTIVSGTLAISCSIARRPWLHCRTVPSRSMVRPFVYSTCSRCTVIVPVTGSTSRMRSFGMSLNRTRRSSGIQSGPSSHSPPDQSSTGSMRSR